MIAFYLFRWVRLTDAAEEGSEVSDLRERESSANQEIIMGTPSFSCAQTEAKENKISSAREVKVRGGKGYEFVKHAFDIFSSGLFLLLFGWIILILMLIKCLEDFGGKSYQLIITENPEGKHLSKDGKRYDCIVFKDKNGEKDPTVHGAVYTSVRVGKNGKLFKFHKIRSMCPGAEKMKDQLLRYGINEADEPAFKLKEDPRITKFGRFIRKTSLDELPQIWDIFLGKLSVVGPRSPLKSELIF